MIKTDLKALAITTRGHALVTDVTIQRWLEEVELSEKTTEVLRMLARDLRDATQYLYDHLFDSQFDSGKLVEIDDLLKLDVLRKLLGAP